MSKHNERLYQPITRIRTNRSLMDHGMLNTIKATQGLRFSELRYRLKVKDCNVFVCHGSHPGGDINSAQHNFNYPELCTKKSNPKIIAVTKIPSTDHALYKVEDRVGVELIEMDSRDYVYP